MNKKYPGKIIFLLPLIILFLLYISGSALLAENNKTLQQIVFFPFILLGFSSLLLNNYFMPRIVYYISAGCALIGVGYSYLYPLKAKRGGLVIATLAGDDLQTQTRIFREKINQVLARTASIKTLSIDQKFNNLSEAEEFISNNKKLKILITGDNKWVNVFFPDKPAQTLGQLGLTLSLSKLTNLQMHYAVRTVGLSMEPIKATAYFLANLSEGVVNYKDRARNNSFELSLLEAGRVDAFWSSFAHKAYPLWFLGNYYTEMTLSSSRPSFQVLNCAINSYKKGYMFLRTGDNPDLKASILNNLGVVYVIRAYYFGKEKDLKSASKSFSNALKIYKHKYKIPVNYSVIDVALNNLSIVNSGKSQFSKASGLRKKKKSKK